MSVDLLQAMERDERAMERLASASEVIAENVTLVVKLLARVVEHEYPVRTQPRDAVVTHIPGPEDELRASQGASEESTEDWIGLREREILERKP